MSRVLFYALGGGWGHLTRVRHLVTELRRRLPLKSLVLCPARALSWMGRVSPCRGVDNVPRPRLARWVEQQIADFAPDLLVVDTFPRGVLGELEISQRPAVLVTRWVHPDYYRKRPVLESLSRYREVCWTEPRSDPGFPGVDCEPVIGEPPLCPDQARAFWGVDRTLVVGLGSGPAAEQLKQARQLQACAQAHGWEARWCSRELATAVDRVHLYLSGADAVISAAGYNSYYEIARAGAPVLWVPQSRLVDDQHRRARGAFPFAHPGPQRVIGPEEQLAPALRALLASPGTASKAGQGKAPRGREQVVNILLRTLEKGNPA